MEIQTSYFSYDLLSIDVKMSRVASESKAARVWARVRAWRKDHSSRKEYAMHIEVGDFHPEIQHQVPRLRRMAKLMRVPGVIRIIDWLRRREAGSDVAGLDCSTVNIPSSLDNYSIRTRIYLPPNVAEPLPCLIYFHGGGYIMGVPEGSAELIKRFIQTRPCVVVAPDYRKAHQKPFPGGFQDCYDAMIWARDNADALGCSDKIIIGGHSAGGGLTAAVALKTRDTGDVDIAFQMPFYPMIDDTQPTDPQRDIDPPVWDTALNAIGWGAYLRDVRRRGETPSAYAAPARAESLVGLPPTITYVGDKDPFYWETEAYVEGLRTGGIDVSHTVYEGCYHAFEYIGEGGEIGAEARTFTFENFALFYDRYVTGTST
jgi:acetyl esterase/lipase